MCLCVLQRQQRVQVLFLLKLVEGDICKLCADKNMDRIVEAQAVAPDERRQETL